MELKFSNNLDSAKRLDGIMNSYSGRDRGCVMADKQSLSVMLLLLERGEITVTEHSYPYDRDIRRDSEMMEVYSELARETRWRRFQYTEIEGIRINALRQMRHEGKPFYDGDFICYGEGKVCIHCGNLELTRLLMYLAGHERTEQFYIFAYPYWTEDQTAKYYRFDLSENAVKGAQAYRNYVWEILCRTSDASGVIPEIPEQNISAQ